MSGLVVHVSRELTPSDIHPSRSPRRTRPARSVIDHASWQTSERRARAIVIAAMQQGLVSIRQIREALTRRGPCRHRALIVESILDASGGVQSLPERDFATIWAATGLPILSRQRRLRRPDGHYYLDAYCEALGFGIEIHGIQHLGVDHWDADLARANEIVIAGEPILQFTSFAVRRQRRRVAEQLMAMAVSRGWDRTDRPAFASLEQPKRRTMRRRSHANA
jgi:very-short-patch-repair endonuclease